jgi:hypothetical protein
MLDSEMRGALETIADAVINATGEFYAKCIF